MSVHLPRCTRVHGPYPSKGLLVSFPNPYCYSLSTSSMGQRNPLSQDLEHGLHVKHTCCQKKTFLVLFPFAPNLASGRTAPSTSGRTYAMVYLGRSSITCFMGTISSVTLWLWPSVRSARPMTFSTERRNPDFDRAPLTISRISSGRQADRTHPSPGVRFHRPAGRPVGPCPLRPFSRTRPSPDGQLPL